MHSPVDDEGPCIWQKSARCLSFCELSSFLPPLTPEGKHLLLKSPLPLCVVLVRILEGLCVWLLPMLRKMNYMVAMAHPRRSDVMLSGVIKIFLCISGGNVSGSGFKRFMPLCFSASHCTLSLGLSMCLRSAHIL